MPGQRESFAGSVFINCPFDNEYWPTFEAVVFTVVACGFTPRCALEELDSGTVLPSVVSAKHVDEFPRLSHV